MNKEEIAMFAKKAQAEEVHYWTITQEQLERYTHYVLSEYKRKHDVEARPREWVGLTNQDIRSTWEWAYAAAEFKATKPQYEFAQAIEAKLKEKNNG